MNNDEIKRRVYICQNKDEAIRVDSTSGGAFSAIARFVLDNNGYVFGAKFDQKFNVVHGVTNNVDGLAEFRGSKYVQSSLGNTYKDIKDLLNKNEWVLFTGTPCQVAGLNAYLGKKYDKLVLMDLVCYSISSPKVWRMYLKHIDDNNLIDVENVRKIKFRDKSRYGYEYTHMSFYSSDNRTMFSSGPESNQFLRSFVSNTSTRPSCYNCAFKSVERVSDFTVWDCYNIYQYDKKLDDNKGSSHIMIHTEKALNILKSLEKYLDFREVDLGAAVSSEPAMTECAEPSEMRRDFFECVSDDKDPFVSFFMETKKVKVERVLRSSLSKIGLYKYIKRALKK